MSAVPLVEKPAAASRLDDIIHQSNTNDLTSVYYNQTEVQQNDSKQTFETVRNSSHGTGLRPRRSDSSSSSSSTSTETNKQRLSSTNNTGLPPKNSSFHRSLEVIPRKTSQTERVLNPTNKATSLEFGKRPVGYDDPGSIYIIPQEAAHPASQYPNTIKGWLRKQNRGKY